MEREEVFKGERNGRRLMGESVGRMENGKEMS
jgi:hypothetical protein